MRPEMRGSEEQLVPSPVTPTSPNTKHPVSLTKTGTPVGFLFSHCRERPVCLCVCLCAYPAVFALRGGKISSLLPGQTFPVCKHWRARDTAASCHARVSAHIYAHAQHKHNLCPSGWLTFSHSGSSRANNCRHNSHLLALSLSPSVAHTEQSKHTTSSLSPYVNCNKVLSTLPFPLPVPDCISLPSSCFFLSHLYTKTAVQFLDGSFWKWVEKIWMDEENSLILE